MLTDEEENVNKNTKTKKSDRKVITDLFTSNCEEKAPGQTPPKTLTVL